MASKVYFADLRADMHENLQQKLTRLMKTAGMGDIDFQDKFVAIKLHFGEPGNLAFLSPNWARTVAGSCCGNVFGENSLRCLSCSTPLSSCASSSCLMR